MPFINRTCELTSIGGLVLDNSNEYRMAIIRARKGMGKSALLGQIRMLYKHNPAAALIDLRCEAYHPIDFVRCLAARLMGQGLRLPSYQAMDSAQAEDPRIDLHIDYKDVRIIKSPMTITPDKDSYNRHRADRLLAQLLADLATTPGPPWCLILIDHYDEAGRPLRDWFQSSVLPTILLKDAARFVVADSGKLLTSAPADDQIDVLGLSEFDAEHISQWLKAVGWESSDDEALLHHDADLVFRLAGGVPGKIEPYIMKLMKRSRT
jgi:hypothetical protein